MKFMNGDLNRMDKLLQKALVPVSFGLLFAAIWLPIGIVTYINMLAGSLTLEYMLHFLLGLPLISIIFGVVLIRRKSGYHLFSIAFTFFTVLMTVLIPIIAE